MKRKLPIVVFLAALCSVATARASTVDHHLYAELGGVHKIAAIVDMFFDRLSEDETNMANPRIAESLAKQNLPVVKYFMTSYLSEKWGGPQKYMGPDMVEWHRKAMISDEEFAAGSKIFIGILEEMKVGEKDSMEIGKFFTWFRAEMKKPSTGMELMMPMGPEGSLYNRLGGTPAIAAVVNEFVNRLGSDPTIGANKNVAMALSSGKVSVAGLKFLVVEQLVMASGGPAVYSGRDMATSHKGLMITEDEWVASAKILKSVLDDFKVPAKEQGEVLAAITSTKGDIVGK